MGPTLTSRSHVADLLGASRLAVDATTGLADVVEAMHHAIGGVPGLRGAATARGRTRGITGLVYGSIRGVTRGVGFGVDALLPAIARTRGLRTSSARRDAALAALNGVVGDYLAATGNPLAIPMRLSHDGLPLALERQALRRDVPRPGGRLLVMVHGLCVSRRQWARLGHDHGAALGRDLGYTVLYLDYNSGLHVSANGRALAEKLEALAEEWPVPVEELAILGHSMGGLVARSACHQAAAAGHRWPRRLGALVFLGTPHHGSPLERAGNWVDAAIGVSRYTAPLGRLGRIRSAGITDLRHGSLLDEDWKGRDRFELARDRRTPVPLPAGVRCHAIAATTASSSGGVRRRLPGDGLVPLDSALGRHRKPGWTLLFPESQLWVGHGMNHFDLLSRPEVYARILSWLQPSRTAAGRSARARTPTRARSRSRRPTPRTGR
jgi:hypothetical protein